jgi:glyoxylase-like metal-dependent hydrolase (beta-lactamase superfamily II)
MLQRAENLWTVDYELRLPMGVPFPTRMSVVRLADGSLTLISPVPIDDVLAGELAAVGPVSHILAPSALHHFYLAAAKGRYPRARLLGPPALSRKEPGLRFEPYGLEPVPSFEGSLAVLPIDGAPKISETVLFHESSRTLIVTDLVFNIETPPSWSTALLLSLTGTRGKLAQSRVWGPAIIDRARARTSCRRIFEWDFDRLVVAHGNVVPTDGKARLRQALARMID